MSLVCVFSVAFPHSFLAPSMSPAEVKSISLLIFTEISKEIADDFSRFWSFPNQCQKDDSHKILILFYWQGWEYEHYFCLLASVVIKLVFLLFNNL